MSITGEASSSPMKVGVAITDISTGMIVAMLLSNIKTLLL